MGSCHRALKFYWKVGHGQSFVLLCLRRCKEEASHKKNHVFQILFETRYYHFLGLLLLLFNFTSSSGRGATKQSTENSMHSVSDGKLMDECVIYLFSYTAELRSFEWLNPFLYSQWAKSWKIGLSFTVIYLAIWRAKRSNKVLVVNGSTTVGLQQLKHLSPSEQVQWFTTAWVHMLTLVSKQSAGDFSLPED